MTRTTHPPDPEYFVCRHCRTVLMDPQPAPFCCALCAAMWAFWQTSGDRDLLTRFSCSQPPDAEVVHAWEARELAALSAEVR